MHEIKINMGDLELTNKTGVILIAPGLGSCIGLAAYDKRSKLAGMAHIVLPDSGIKANTNSEEKIGKYADIAVPALLGKMLSLGSRKEDLIIKIVGGAQMFSFKNDVDILNIGHRNTVAVKKALDSLGLTITKADTGGNKGRTFTLNVMNGSFSLRITGQQEMEF